MTVTAALPAPAAPLGRQPASDPAGFGVYIHWPFCAAKCPYCDFNSHVRHGGIDEARFLAAYLREIDHAANVAPDRIVASIFLGGGTPSLMAPATVAAILDQIAQRWTIDPAAEITLEANPSSVEAGRFKGYRAAGVNRVSLGVQALNDRDLKALGRLHDRAGALAALEVARTTFERFSFDLIYARSGQTVDAWRTELTEALSLAAGHLSLYQLTIEDGTPFAALHASGKLVVPDPQVAAAMFACTDDCTRAAGLPAYEISNHARPGQESRHNLIYWRYGEYAGNGPGAHGRLIIGGRRTATSTERNPERWAEFVEQNGHGWVENTPLSLSEQADERLLMGLRLAEGIDLAELAALTALRPCAKSLNKLENMEWIEFVGKERNRIRATPSARIVLNEVVARVSAALEPVAAPLNRAE